MIPKGQLEYIRSQAKSRFDSTLRQTWIDCGMWASPARTKWLLSQTEGQRNNQLIVDPTHILALRSYVAGFLEGNTSASRPWFRIQHQNPDVNKVPENKIWLEHYTRRTMNILSTSNFYDAAAQFYYDFGCFNTGTHFIDEIENGLHFHTLTPGSYYCINNNLGIATTLVREFNLNVKALVDAYGKKNKSGQVDWSNFSPRVKKLYDDSNYIQKIDVVSIVTENKEYDPSKPTALLNKQWITHTYEVGSSKAAYDYSGDINQSIDPSEGETMLRVSASKRKPFIVGRSASSNNYEYGEKGPTTDALGLIKSLNKKAISKDIALEKMLEPTLQGPANLKKSYITQASRGFIPLDPASLAKGGLSVVNPINSGINILNQDVTDMRSQVEKLYYADYLLYLSRNPKTRTATETNAVVNEQQLIIGPNLQSLNWTYNLPVIEFVMQYVLEEDPLLEPPPKALAGQWLRTEFVSVFAQAQKAADLPAVDRFVQMVQGVGQLEPSIWDKVNLDKLCDLYEDRLFLPEGLNNPQNKVDKIREARQQQQQRQQMMENMPGLAGAAKDASQIQQPQQQGGQPPQQE